MVLEELAEVALWEQSTLLLWEVDSLLAAASWEDLVLDALLWEESVVVVLWELFTLLWEDALALLEDLVLAVLVSLVVLGLLEDLVASVDSDLEDLALCHKLWEVSTPLLLEEDLLAALDFQEDLPLDALVVWAVLALEVLLATDLWEPSIPVLWEAVLLEELTLQLVVLWQGHLLSALELLPPLWEFELELEVVRSPTSR